jgi:hypothetical protein
MCVSLQPSLHIIQRRRTSRVQSAICHEVSWICAVAKPTKSSSRVIFLVLVVNPSCPHCPTLSLCWTFIHDASVLRGSSSSRFSKYLLPKRSIPIRVPRLVSPIASQHHPFHVFSLPGIPMNCRTRSRVSRRRR